MFAVLLMGLFVALVVAALDASACDYSVRRNEPPPRYTPLHRNGYRRTLDK